MPAGVLAPTAENAELVVTSAREQVAAFDARIDDSAVHLVAESDHLRSVD